MNVSLKSYESGNNEYPVPFIGYHVEFDTTVEGNKNLYSNGDKFELDGAYVKTYKRNDPSKSGYMLTFENQNKHFSLIEFKDS